MTKDNYKERHYKGLTCSLLDMKDKKSSLNRHVWYMYNRTLGMFRYDGLPPTIPDHILEMYLQMGGFAGIVPHNGEIYCLQGGLGGEPDYNYEPTILTVANPALKFSRNLKINEECVIIKNDDLYMGLMPMYEYYGSQLTENELSMYITSINTRIVSLISAGDEDTRKAAEEYLKKVLAGDFGVIGENQFFDGIKVQPYNTAASQLSIKSLIEYEQYLKASWFNEIGLDANYNMKRETLTDSENEMNKASLYPLIDRMFYNRKKGIEKVNELFGTNWSVELSGEWERMMKRNKQAEDLIEAEIEEVKDNEEEQSEVQDEEKENKEIEDERETEDS